MLSVSVHNKGAGVQANAGSCASPACEKEGSNVHLKKGKNPAGCVDCAASVE